MKKVVGFLSMVIVWMGCSPSAINSLNCNPPNANVHFNWVNVSDWDGYGVIGYDLPNYRVLGVVGYCNPQNTTDTILRIHIPSNIPDTPYTYSLGDYYNLGPNQGYVWYVDYQYAYGSLTIDTITPDSFASGNFHFTGKLNTTQTWNFPNHSTNTIDSYALDSICIQDGHFTNVKIYN